MKNYCGNKIASGVAVAIGVAVFSLSLSVGSTSLAADPAISLGANGHTHYVEPKGDLEEAMGKLRAGDTLILKKGVYQLKGMIKPKFSLKGTEKMPITIKGEDGAIVKGLYNKATNKDSHKPDEYSGIGIWKSQWVVVENIEMCNNGTIYIGDEHITYRNCHIHDYSNYALIPNGSRFLTVEGCKIHGSTVEHAIYLTTDNTDTVIRNCDFSDTAINGVHINGGKNRRILLEGNRFHQVSRDWGACITLMGASEIIIRNNVFFCNLGHSITAVDKKNAVPSGVQIYNNTFYQASGGRNGAFLVCDAKPQNWDVHHNVFYTTKLMEGSSAGFKDVKFHDNLYSPAIAGEATKVGEKLSNDSKKALQFKNAPGLTDLECDLSLNDEKLNKEYGAFAESPKDAKFIPGVNP